MKKIITLILILLILYDYTATAQAGKRQVGFRAGYRSGIFYQVTGNAGNAETGYMLMASFHDNGVQFTGLKVTYEMALSEISPDLILAWGYGGHIGFVYTNHLGYLGEEYYFQQQRFCPLLGIDGWCSAEYRFRKIPMTLSLNVKPYIELVIPAFVKVMPFDFGFSAAYTF